MLTESQQSHPQAPYFRGGYNTARHGRDAAPLAGLQIETYSRGVRDTPESRAKFARALAETLETYLAAQLGVSLVSRPKGDRKPVPAAEQAPIPTGAALPPQHPRRRLLRRIR